MLFMQYASEPGCIKESQWWPRGGLGATAPPPVGRNFGFSSEEIWQNNARKHDFSVIFAPCRKLQPLCRKISGATPERAKCVNSNTNQKNLKISFMIKFWGFSKRSTFRDTQCLVPRVIKIYQIAKKIEK